jgi:hypothetical protein
LKEACLKTLCQRTGRGVRRNGPCRGMYLELRLGPVSREHARPQPPAASRRYAPGTEEAQMADEAAPRTRAASAPGGQPPVRRRGRCQMSQPRCRSGSPATEPSGPGRGQVEPLGPRPAHPHPSSSSSLDPGGKRRPNPRPLAPRIAQLVFLGFGAHISRRGTSRPSAIGHILVRELPLCFVLCAFCGVAAGPRPRPRGIPTAGSSYILRYIGIYAGRHEAPREAGKKPTAVGG